MTTKSDLVTMRRTNKENDSFIDIPSGDPNKDFNALFDFSKDMLMAKGQVETTLAIIDGKKRVMGMIAGAGLPADPEIRETIFKNIGIDFANRLPGADNFVLISEGWATIGQPTEITQPSLSPDRVEVLSIGAKRADGKERVLVQSFARDLDGKIRFVKTRKDFKKDFDTGWVNPKQGDKADLVIQNNLLLILWNSFKFTQIMCKIDKTK